MKFSGSVMLPAPVLVTGDCLRNEIVGAFAGTSFTLTFPSPGPERILELQEPPFHNLDWLQDEKFEPRSWGYLLSDETALVAGVAIELETSAVTPRQTKEKRDDYVARVEYFVREAFAPAFWAWISRVSTLLELWSGQRVERSHATRTERASVHLFDHAIDTGFTADGSHEGNSTDSSMPAGVTWRKLSFEDWIAAASLVSEQNDVDVPALPWLMFNRARRLSLFDRRFAVIEACGAIEVAVGSLIDSSLYGHSEQAKELIIVNAGGLVGLMRLASQIDTRKPSCDYSNDLAKVRNQAAHAGMEPTQKQVNLALECARKILDTYLPLPHLPTAAVP